MKNFPRNSLILIIAIVSFAAFVGSGSSDSKSGDKAKSTSEADDVKIVTCEDGALGFPEVQLEATNSSSKKSDYIITIAIESADGKVKYGDAAAVISGVEPDQIAKETSMATAKAEAGYTCRISDVSRNASL